MSRDKSSFYRTLLRVRCTKCRTRNKLYSDQMDQFSCKNCDHNKFNRTNDKVCHCDGYQFPHRMGSRFCGFDKEGAKKILSDEDLEEMHNGCLGFYRRF